MLYQPCGKRRSRADIARSCDNELSRRCYEVVWYALMNRSVWNSTDHGHWRRVSGGWRQTVPRHLNWGGEAALTVTNGTSSRNDEVTRSNVDVTSSITWPFDTPYVISYWWSFGTKPLSLTVSEIFNVKCNTVVDVTLIRPLNKGQGHSFWYQSISHIRLPIGSQ